MGEQPARILCLNAHQPRRDKREGGAQKKTRNRQKPRGQAPAHQDQSDTRSRERKERTLGKVDDPEEETVEGETEERHQPFGDRIGPEWPADLS